MILSFTKGNSAAILVALIVALGCTGRGRPPRSPVGPIATVTAASTVAPTTLTPSVFEAGPTRPVPLTTSAPFPGQVGNIVIQSPQGGDRITSPVTVNGKARVFEATLELVVRDSLGRQLGMAVVTASEAAPAWGEFTAQTEFASPSREERGSIEAYNRSARDGSIENLVRVQVILLPK